MGHLAGRSNYAKGGRLVPKDSYGTTLQVEAVAAEPRNYLLRVVNEWLLAFAPA